MMNSKPNWWIAKLAKPQLFTGEKRTFYLNFAKDNDWFCNRRNFYLPFCINEQSYHNLCDAVCAANEGQTPTKGSCDRCEVKKCTQVFLPVCSPDGEKLYANECHAKCANAQYTECKGLNMVIPGKTPLPPNKELPLRLQNLSGDNEDDNSV